MVSLFRRLTRRCVTRRDRVSSSSEYLKYEDSLDSHRNSPSIDGNGYAKDSFLESESDPFPEPSLPSDSVSDVPQAPRRRSQRSKPDAKASHITIQDSSSEDEDEGEAELKPVKPVPAEKCSICDGGHDQNQLLTCSECSIQYHTYCLAIPADLLNDLWLCTTCALLLRTRKAGKKRGRPPTAKPDKRSLLELSVTVARKGRDIPQYILPQFTEWMRTNCSAGAVSRERGDALEHAHLQVGPNAALPPGPRSPFSLSRQLLVAANIGNTLSPRAATGPSFQRTSVHGQLCSLPSPYCTFAAPHSLPQLLLFTTLLSCLARSINPSHNAQCLLPTPATLTMLPSPPCCSCRPPRRVSSASTPPPRAR